LIQESTGNEALSMPGLRVLLSDGSGLTARQTAPQLAAAGHTVEVLTSSALPLTAFTRHVAKLHRVPPYGPFPLAWLDAALKVLANGHFDILLPTQEQVAVLSRCADRVTALGVKLAVPPFDALMRVQDKVSAAATLRELGLPQPKFFIAATPQDLIGYETQFPVYVKTPIGTAATGVRRVVSQAALRQVAIELEASGGFDLGGIVVQQSVEGPLVMAQAVYAQGRLLAAHTNLREREGVNGGASAKCSTDQPTIRAHLERLGKALGWHGALALDVILTPHGPSYIDINPRLVEPGNAWRSGVDLVDMMLKVSQGQAPKQPLSPGRADIHTHQLLLALLAAAERDGRRAVLRELREAARHSGLYGASQEELTPIAGDWRAGAPVALAALATLIAPATWRWFASNAVSNYSLTPRGWQALLPRPSGDAHHDHHSHDHHNPRPYYARHLQS
jgi:glutathione synthase/RimK-type ligase-like ATP-grasp enzyme